MASLDFWFSIGSTYTCLTVHRIEEAATRAGVSVTWRPYNVRTVMMEQNNIPFADKPIKTAYMWRDIERRAAARGLDVTVPAPYPITDLALANQIALLGMGEGWGADFVRAAYTRWFRDGQEAGAEPCLSDALRAAGQDADAALAKAGSAEIVAALEHETRIATDLGVFGAPSFVVGGEVFWGDDRLEDALSWALHGAL